MVAGEVLTGGVEVIDGIAAEWRALCEEGACDEPFYRPEWIRAYLRAFAPAKTVVIATARADGRLIAVLPLVRETGLLGGVPARKLRSAGNVHTCRYDLVHGRTAVEEGIAAIWRALRKTAGWDVLELRAVPWKGAAGRLARLAKSDGHRVRAKKAPSSPYVKLASGADAFDAVLARVDAKFRANVRRRMRKLEAIAPVRVTRSDTVGERLERFYALEREGWKGAEGSAIASSADTRAFYDEVAAEAQRFGYLSLYALESADRPIAMHYGLTCNGRYFVLKTAYDETLREYSPGQLVTQEVFRDLAARGCTELDFLGISMDWKEDWAPRPRPHANWYVFRGPVGSALEVLRFRILPPIVRVLRKRRRA